MFDELSDRTGYLSAFRAKSLSFPSELQDVLLPGASNGNLGEEDVRMFLG